MTPCELRSPPCEPQFFCLGNGHKNPALKPTEVKPALPSIQQVLSRVGSLSLLSCTLEEVRVRESGKLFLSSLPASRLQA